MTSIKDARRPRSRDYGALGAAARQHLCALAETPTERTCHAAALLAFTPTVTHTPSSLSVQIKHGPTAYWLTQVLSHRDAELVDVGGDGATVDIRNPELVLRRHGFRDGQWVFGRGDEAAVGMCRGAVHAAARFSGHGMKLDCPSAAAMLTLVAMLGRLGIKATPSAAGESRLAVGPADISPALDRLGMAAVAAQYHATVGGHR